MNRKRNRVRVRPGRETSLVSGIVALLIGLFVLLAFPSGMDGSGGPFGPPAIFGLFPILFFVVTLIIAAVSFYNAFSARGVARYEVEIEESAGDATLFCPACGQPVESTDRFCRRCGAALD